MQVVLFHGPPSVRCYLEGIANSRTPVCSTIGLKHNGTHVGSSGMLAKLEVPSSNLRSEGSAKGSLKLLVLRA
eukprot:1929472-Amphidinium_carterae.1